MDSHRGNPRCFPRRWFRWLVVCARQSLSQPGTARCEPSVSRGNKAGLFSGPAVVFSMPSSSTLAMFWVGRTRNTPRPSPTLPRPVITPLTCALVEKTDTIRFRQGSILAAAYGCLEATEGYHCSYGINPAFLSAIVSGPLRVSAEDRIGEVRAVELEGHPFFRRYTFSTGARGFDRENPSRCRCLRPRDRRDAQKPADLSARKFPNVTRQIQTNISKKISAFISSRSPRRWSACV